MGRRYNALLALVIWSLAFAATCAAADGLETISDISIDTAGRDNIMADVIDLDASILTAAASAAATQEIKACPAYHDDNSTESTTAASAACHLRRSCETFCADPGQAVISLTEQAVLLLLKAFFIVTNLIIKLFKTTMATAYSMVSAVKTMIQTIAEEAVAKAAPPMQAAVVFATNAIDATIHLTNKTTTNGGYLVSKVATILLCQEGADLILCLTFLYGIVATLYCVCKATKYLSTGADCQWLKIPQALFCFNDQVCVPIFWFGVTNLVDLDQRLPFGGRIAAIVVGSTPLICALLVDLITYNSDDIKAFIQFRMYLLRMKTVGAVIDWFTVAYGMVHLRNMFATMDRPTQRRQLPRLLKIFATIPCAPNSSTERNVFASMVECCEQVDTIDEATCRALSQLMGPNKLARMPPLVHLENVRVIISKRSRSRAMIVRPRDSSSGL